jgi:branched-subunit amino acid transport protein
VSLSRRLCVIKCPRVTSRVNWLKGEKTKGLLSADISTLTPRPEMVLETLVFSPFNQFTWLVAKNILLNEDNKINSAYITTVKAAVVTTLTVMPLPRRRPVFIVMFIIYIQIVTRAA